MSTAGEESTNAFLNRPQARKGPDVPYKNEASSNPVLRGVALAVLSKMYGQ